LQPVGVPLSGDFNFSDSNWSPEVTLSWKPMPDSLLYIAYKTGYKSGGFSSPNLVQTFQNAGNLSYKSERSRGVEAGFKAELANRSLRLEAAVYSFQYKDLQVSQFDQATFSYFIVNAATARIKGAELSALWQATPALRLNASAAYNKATYSSFPTGQCYNGQTEALGCVDGSQDLTGASLTGAPRWTLTGGATYDFAVDTDMMIGLSADASYTGSYITSEDHAPVTAQKSYTLLNAGVRLYQSNERWELAFIGRNLANKFYKLVSSSKPFALPDEYFTFTPRARELRVQGTFRF
jgi:outer membrane receptor protein involved in Fe transport